MKQPWNVIAALRNRKGMTQAEVVETLRPALSIRQLQGYEAGDRPVSPAHAKALAALLGGDADYIRNNGALAGRIKHLLAESEVRDLTEEELSVFPEELAAHFGDWLAYRRRTSDLAAQLQANFDKLNAISEGNRAEDRRLFEEFISIKPGTPNIRERFAEVEQAREALKPRLQEQRDLEMLVFELGQQLQRESLNGYPIAFKLDQYVVANYGPY